MAKQTNWNLVIAVLALAVIGYSFVSGATTGAQIVTPANSWCKDTDAQNQHIAGSCEDSSGATATDACVDYNTVNEGFCSLSNVCSHKYMNCLYGEQCVKGVCVAA